MNSKNAIQDELKQLGSTLDREHAMPVFNLPENYFENFAASVMARIKREEAMNAQDELKALSSTLSAIPRKMPFSVPEGYFNNLTNELPTLVTDDPIPMELKTISRKVPYEVPAGYFENLPAQLLEKVSKPKTKIISLSNHRFRNLAAAAIVTGIMAISGIYYFANNSGKSIDPANQPNAWVAAKLKNVSNQELEDFIQNTGSTLYKKDVAKTSVTTQEVRRLLNDVPDKELDAFLQAIPSDDLSMIN
ncbi:MAG: hypothetical protein ABIN57_01525 [Chitinophagaceae bacterium]